MVRPREGDKRARILDAAVQVFSQKGFYHSRVSDVADVAGVAGGTIYLYFKGKDDVLISLFEDRMEKILTDVREMLDNETDASARLRAFIGLHLALVDRDPALADILTVELRQSSKFVREYRPHKFFEYLDVAEDILNQGIQSGQFRPDIQPKVWRRALFGALDEVTLMWVACLREGVDPPSTLAEAASTICNLMLSGLMIPEPIHEE